MPDRHPGTAATRRPMPAQDKRSGAAASAVLGMAPINRPASQRDALDDNAETLHASSVIVPKPRGRIVRHAALARPVGTPICPRAARYPGLRSPALPSHWPRAGIGRRFAAAGTTRRMIGVHREPTNLPDAALARPRWDADLPRTAALPWAAFAGVAVSLAQGWHRSPLCGGRDHATYDRRQSGTDQFAGAHGASRWDADLPAHRTLPWAAFAGVAVSLAQGWHRSPLCGGRDQRDAMIGVHREPTNLPDTSALHAALAQSRWDADLPRTRSVTLGCVRRRCRLTGPGLA